MALSFNSKHMKAAIVTYLLDYHPEWELYQDDGMWAYRQVHDAIRFFLRRKGERGSRLWIDIDGLMLMGFNANPVSFFKFLFGKIDAALGAPAQTKSKEKIGTQNEWGEICP